MSFDDPMMLQGSCANHDDAPVTAICGRCGDFICDQCVQQDFAGNVFCERCERGQTSSSSPLEWEDDNEGLVMGFLLSLKRSLLTPTDFFRSVSPQGSFASPLGYAMICLCFTLTMSMLQQGIMMFSDMDHKESLAFMWTGLWDDLLDQNAAYLSIAIVAAFLGFILMLFAWMALRAGLYTVVTKALSIEGSSFIAMWRVTSYASGVQVMGALASLVVLAFGSWHELAFTIASIFAALLGMAIYGYELVLNGIGIREVLKTTTSKAVLSVVLYIVGAMLMFCGIYLVVLVPVVFMLIGTR